VVGYLENSAVSLEWPSEGPGTVEVHVGAHNRPPFSRTGPSGHVTTGKWMTDGIIFYLQDVLSGLPFSPENTLDRVVVKVTKVETEHMNGDAKKSHI